jgi:hypothetical protein
METIVNDVVKIDRIVQTPVYKQKLEKVDRVI